LWSAANRACRIEARSIRSSLGAAWPASHERKTPPPAGGAILTFAGAVYGRGGPKMHRIGDSFDREAPAALGAPLSQAIFFLDPTMGAGLMRARIKHEIASVAAQDIIRAYPRVNRALISSQFAAEEFELGHFVSESAARVLFELAAGRFIASGLLDHRRVDFVPSHWEAVSTPKAAPSIFQWLTNEASLQGKRIASVRVRPRLPVSRDLAALATADYRVLASFLVSPFGDGRSLPIEIIGPLEKAISAGFVTCPATITVHFPEFIEETAPQRTIIDNLNELGDWTGHKEVGGRPDKYQWDAPIARATVYFQRLHALQSDFGLKDVEVFLEEQFPENDAPGGSRIRDKARVVIEAVRPGWKGR
jgi:hypothetical protein